jgi:hypothetical protein
MDITMIGLQNAGKTSLLRVLAVSLPWCQVALPLLPFPHHHDDELTECVQGGEFTVEYVNVCSMLRKQQRPVLVPLFCATNRLPSSLLVQALS